MSANPASAAVPRDRVSAENLNVAPTLLGLPLAHPAKRLVAIGIDMVVVGAVSTFGNVWLVAGLAALALALLREPTLADAGRRRRRAFLLAAGLLAFGAWDLWHAPPDAHSAHRGAHTLRALARRGLDAAMPGAVHKAATAASSAASDADDTDELPAEARIAALEAELAEARQPRHFDLGAEIDRWTHDVGLRLGWAVAYFSLLPAWWRGQTVGKRLMGLRIVELTGRPMTAMRSFKRYGGYGAGVATGMFGFLQVLWDPNRQAIQDKTAHTVVVDLRRPAVAETAPATDPSSPTAS